MIIKSFLVTSLLLVIAGQPIGNSILEPQNYQDVRNRIEISITDSEFPDIANRVLEWIPMRNVDSPDYMQKTVTYWCYWKGAEFPNGDIEAHAEIYNRPDDLQNYVIEISRFGWYEVTVKKDGEIICVFPNITQDNIPQLGYVTIGVSLP
jgi:hypothetical protein